MYSWRIIRFCRFVDYNIRVLYGSWDSVKCIGDIFAIIVTTFIISTLISDIFFRG